MPWPVTVCTWFDIGRLRPAPGTWGTLAAVALALPLLTLIGGEATRWALVAAVAMATVAGIAWSPTASRHFGVEDPSQVVIDEVAGTWLALAVMPGHLLDQPVLACGAAFVLFRVFDIAKPWPVTWCEHLPGGWGIMADDLAAGLLAGGLASVLFG